MDSSTEAILGSKKMLWAGWVLSILPALLLVSSSLLKLAKFEPVVEEFARFGYAESLILPIGIVELACAVVFLIPRTAVLGAILLTGYLGGATATHLRIGDPFIGPVVVGMLVWGGLVLRDSRLRELVSVRR